MWQGGEVETRLAHNQKIGGANPPPATNYLYAKKKEKTMHKFNNVFVGICKFFSMSHQWREGIQDRPATMHKDSSYVAPIVAYAGARPF